MFYTGLFKRVLPFFLTFAAGLFVASFFVSITPDFNWQNTRPSYRSRECRRMKAELRELREENHRLRQHAEVHTTIDNMDWENAVPPVPVEAPHPPKAPRYR
jgi:hypothetical protein